MLDDRLIERFKARRQKQKGKACWLWVGPPQPNGYGRMHFHRMYYYVHRLAWMIAYGNIKTTQLVCHRCDNRMCVRPSHLFLGTIQDNLSDMRSKGRGAKGSMFSTASLHEEDVQHILYKWKRWHHAHRERGAKMLFCKRTSKIFNTSISAIYNVIQRNNYRHVSFV